MKADAQTIATAPVDHSVFHEPADGGHAPPLDIDAGRPLRGLFIHSGLDHAMGLYLPATVAVRLINFARVLLLTWWMIPQQFGLLNMILLAINVLTPLCSLGLNEAITRYVPQEETRGCLQSFLRRSFILLSLITVVSVALIWIWAKPLGDFLYAQVFADQKLREEFGRDAPELAKLSGVVTGLVIVYFYLLAVLKGLRMFKALAVLEMVSSVLFLAAAAIAIAPFPRAAHTSAFTMTALYGISLAAPIAYIGYRFGGSMAAWTAQTGLPEESQWASKLLRFSVWTTIAGITWQILVSYPTWYLNKLHGHDAVAIFSAPRQIGQFVLIGAAAVVTVVMTTVTKTWESRGRAAAERQLSLAFRGTGLGLLIFCSVLALFKHLIIKMFRAEYAPGADILPLHLLFFLIGSFLAFLPIHFHLIERTRHLFWPWAIGVAANVLYGLWLAGPGLSTIKHMAVWRWLAPYTSAFFITDFSSPMGLNSAAWCGVFAIATALLLCVILIRAECTKLDRGTYIILFSAWLLALNSWMLSIGLLILVFLAFRTELVFTQSERRRVFGYIRNSLRHVPALGRMRNGS